MPDFIRCRAALMDDFVKAAIEPRQRLGDAVGRGRRRGNRAPFRVAVRNAFELLRQRIETLVDGSEVFADVIVVIRFPV
jgi:hypothetical protein